MSEILLSGGRTYSLVYDDETEMYGYTDDMRHIPWTWAKTREELKIKVGGF